MCNGGAHLGGRDYCVERSDVPRVNLGSSIYCSIVWAVRHRAWARNDGAIQRRLTKEQLEKQRGGATGRSNKNVAWCNLTRAGDPRPTDADWCEFVHSSEFPKRNCPSSFSIPLQDAPTISKSANNSRKLYFHVVAKSAAECECWSDAVV